MSIWLITDPKAERIFGTAEAHSQYRAIADVVDRGLAEWFWRSKPGPHEQLSVHPLETFAGDGQWRELGTSTPLPGRDIGGDGQDSESYSRRFGLIRPDGTWAVVTLYWYAYDDSLRRCDDKAQPGDRLLERQAELLILSEGQDVHALDGGELWESTLYSKEWGFPVTEQGAILAATDFDPARIRWDGEIDPGTDLID